MRVNCCFSTTTVVVLFLCSVINAFAPPAILIHNSLGGTTVRTSSSSSVNLQVAPTSNDHEDESSSSWRAMAACSCSLALLLSSPFQEPALAMTSAMTQPDAPECCAALHSSSVQLADRIKVIDAFTMPTYDDVKGATASVENVGSLSGKQPKGYELLETEKAVGEFTTSSGLGINFELPSLGSSASQAPAKQSPAQKQAAADAAAQAVQQAQDAKLGRQRVTVTLPKGVGLGISLENKPVRQDSSIGGTVVTEINDNSPLAGQLKVGDELVSWNGQDISKRSLKDLKLLLNNMARKPNDTINLTIVRRATVAAKSAPTAAAAAAPSASTEEASSVAAAAPTPAAAAPKTTTEKKTSSMPAYDF